MPELSAYDTFGHELGLDNTDAVAKHAVGKGSSSSSSTNPRSDPPKKTRLQSDAPDDIQLAMDIAAALAKDKEATTLLPAPSTTGNISGMFLFLYRRWHWRCRHRKRQCCPQHPFGVRILAAKRLLECIGILARGWRFASTTSPWLATSCGLTLMRWTMTTSQAFFA